MHLAASLRTVDKVVSRKPVVGKQKEFTKSQLYDMLTEAVKNTG
jgi:hypothetical protein